MQIGSSKLNFYQITLRTTTCSIWVWFSNVIVQSIDSIAFVNFIYML